MKLYLRTSVSQSYQQVWKGFDEALFRQLSPPFPPVRVVRFEGCKKGDVVELELNFLFFRQRWTSFIVEQQAITDEIYFVDEGIKLPFFLKYWHHRHRIIQERPSSTIIADEIEYSTPSLLTDYLFYPLLWAQFAYRKPIYRRYFKSKS